MALVDTYRNNMVRKKEELVKLSHDRANEQTKISSLRSKINSAENTISRTKSSSTIQSKLREIESARKSLLDIEKKIVSLEKRIVSKQKEYNAEEKNFMHEEGKINKKREQDERKRTQENEQQLRTMNRSLQQQNYLQQHLSYEIEKLKYVPEKITVLFFATNPKDTGKLRLDEEVRSIQEVLRKSEHRESILFESRWAVRPLDILQAINELNPDVIHFSGHGAKGSELLLENSEGNTKYITKEAIAQVIMSASDKIHLMFFNTCFSYEQAMMVTEHVDAAIGMTDAISDSGACSFAAQFYSSLGFGLSLKKAYEQAKGALMLEDTSEGNKPILYTRDGIDPDDLYIVKPKNSDSAHLQENI